MNNINEIKKSMYKEKRKKRQHLDADNTILNKNNILEYYFNLPINNKKAFNKITDNDFSIPKINEYTYLLINNYNVSQLKIIAKYHKIKTTGNKEFLKKQIHNYLYYSFNVIIIQKLTRSYLLKKYIFLHGPAVYNRSLCSNDVDFCSLDNLNDIPYNQFISFRDNNDHVYGFDIMSLYNLFLKMNKNITNSSENSNNFSKDLTNVENPFTTQAIPINVLTQLVDFIRLSNILKINISLNYNDLLELSENKKIEIKILTLFQRIDSLGNYTNIKWFNDLDKYNLVQFIRELFDIWNYRANLCQSLKREIVPPTGNPFYDGHININNLQQYNFLQLKKYAIYVIDLMVNKGINENSCSLGSYYVLCALTLVSQEAANSLPWLYEAVSYN